MPVLFLTAHGDGDTIRQVFAAGADDFVSKPIVGPELITRITNRLERTRLLRALAETDALTGVANRRKFTQVLEHFFSLADRQGQPLCLAILDLDHFKRVNDRYGHAAGDEVLHRLGEVLRRAFRGEDVVARWGGEEFLVGMYGMSRDDGVQRTADALEAWRQEEFDGPADVRFSITFSAGVAEYPADGGDLQALYRAADQALYQAKEAGRDRVLPVGWHPERGPAERRADVVVVDDDEPLAALLLHALETRGYRTRWLKDGQEVPPCSPGRTRLSGHRSSSSTWTSPASTACPYSDAWPRMAWRGIRGSLCSPSVRPRPRSWRRWNLGHSITSPSLLACRC